MRIESRGLRLQGPRIEREGRAPRPPRPWVPPVGPSGMVEPRPWPPPPHDPDEREIVAYLGEWEVRRFGEASMLFRYAAPRGVLHLQVWHPAARVSILTPSRITGGSFEAFPVAGWKLACRGWKDLARAIRREHALDVPSAGRMRSLERWFVTAEERRAVRATLARELSSPHEATSDA